MIQKIKTSLKNSLAVLFVMVVLMVLTLNSCMQMRTSDKATSKRFQQSQIKSQIITFKPKGYDFTTRTIKTFKSEQPFAVVFIHGAPGSSDAYFDYLENSQLLDKAVMYSVDRVGYGYSDYGNALNSIEEQALIISKFIDKHVIEENVIVVGHSYGGPIAAYISAINNKIVHLIMLAPANDPENEKIFWFSHFAKWKLTKWMLPKPLQVSGDEKFSHAEELLNIQEIWQDIQVPTTYYHGKKDSLVPIINLEFTKNAMKNSEFKEVIFENENHFIVWTQKEIVTTQILEIINKRTTKEEDS